MKVILFGASGMVGQGVLRECLLDQGVESILVIGRSPIGKQDGRITEIVRDDVGDLEPLKEQLQGYDACFFCLGVSSVGMKEEDYRRITYDLTLRVARILAELNPGMTFIYVTGTGADSTEKGRVMWARVKGATENALLKLPFKAAYMFRPGVIQPMHGIVSRTKLYRFLYPILAPLIGLVKVLAPDFITTTEQVGLAMLKAARDGAPKTWLENRDINAL